MNARSISLCLLLAFTTAHAHGADSYCRDPDAIADWNAMLEKYPGSDDWQRLHALWLGLCHKVEAGSIDLKRAIDLFEAERSATIRRMRRQPDNPGELSAG